jgi:NADPH-dependent 2,4-dienoyl-CoA reductase/sulfur reductase-like enzyme
LIIEPDVLIVGAGPAGLAAAAALAARGIDQVLVIEREPEAGGIPRICRHATFGLTDFLRPMSGPSYASRLRAMVDGSKILTGATVTAIGSDLEVSVSQGCGTEVVRPKRILLATGIRETPRAARLVSGDRPQNVLTTGALQRLVEAGAELPFRAPVVIGTELVSFSAVLTLRHAGIKPVAMIESGPRIVARRPADLLTRYILRTPVMTGWRLSRINGSAFDASKLESVTVEGEGGGSRNIPCDAVIFSGGFVPEASLLAGLADARDGATRGPGVDQCWRLADPRIYAAGNVLRAVETAAWSRREGMAAGNAIADDLLGAAEPRARLVPLVCSGPILFATPSAIAVPGPQPGPLHMMIRMGRAAAGRITISVDGAVLWRSRSATFRPHRRIGLCRRLPFLSGASSVEIGFEATPAPR